MLLWLPIIVILLEELVFITGFNPYICTQPINKFNCTFSYNEETMSYESSSDCRLIFLNPSDGIFYWRIDNNSKDTYWISTATNICPQDVVWKECFESEEECSRVNILGRGRTMPTEEKNYFCKSGTVVSFESCLVITGIGGCLIFLGFLFIASKYVRKLKGSSRVVEMTPCHQKKLELKESSNPHMVSLSNPLTLVEISSQIKVDGEALFKNAEKEFYTIASTADQLKEMFKHGNKPGNQNKNPDPDLLPYDSNRVVLNPGSENTDIGDYVNASWVRHANLDTELIITGLPTRENPETLPVFWKMIRDYKVNHIVLFVDTRKAEHSVFFPDEKGTENSLDIMSSIYPELSLTLTEKSKTAELVDYFDIRIQTNRSSNSDLVEMHKVKIHQFKTLPDYKEIKGTAAYLECVQEVWRNISADDLNKSAIAFVSDLGIKHSAVMIALIALIAIPSVEDYKFLYDALGHYSRVKELSSNKNFLSVENLSEVRRISGKFMRRVKSHYEKDKVVEEFKLLEAEKAVMSPKSIGEKEENQKWNWDQEVLPYDFNRVIMWKSDNRSDYINASYFRFENFYVPDVIISQGPSPHIPGSTERFWQMASQSKASCVIRLECTAAEDYKPGQEMKFGKMSLSQTLEELYGGFCACRAILQTGEDSEESQIDLITLSYWPEYQDLKKKDGKELLDTVTEIWEYCNKSGIVIVHCDKGIKRSGIFMVLSLLLYRKNMKTGNISGAVKELRSQRDKMVPDLDDLKFLHQVVQAYQK
ncbi:receptor-type tyrosine-protein phosphatase alpha isoform X2 [Eurytemora carolleeae]|uniref:receptor-type tyrosine-protein phosphatase alpha isoform X2 n=1 Tax=Eurytemora carolleeae TaxID=1294199 RepID=UPI000C78C062|nr:receptor-type tyrosine-protein phosphatase alpha isoform X2 [Eurytemora carolleeae]|eukprot:XP_023346216.1 receptor-type tyrosine-protein phosphatase alpha-like isoform X2 [Eurytemora affinis]